MKAYFDLIQSGELQVDDRQEIVARKFDAVATQLSGYEARDRTKRRYFWQRESKPIRGLYVWGDVGRGKSMLMDMFVEIAPVAQKRRIHFHAFMRDFHEALHDMRQSSVEDPVVEVAHNFADGVSLLCLDELQILDITDAMLVGRIFDVMFERGVVVVATSNRHPDDLYKNGLNRHLFVPFITRIKQELDVVELGGTEDFRLRELERIKVYHTPLDTAAKQAMDEAWQSLTHGEGAEFIITHTGRDLVIPLFHNGVGRGSFADFCGAPLGPNDYLQMAAVLKVLVLDDIPALSRQNNNEAKRFVTLIDALYDYGVRLICSAEKKPELLYEDGPGAFEFRRTASRLVEMQAADWGASPAKMP